MQTNTPPPERPEGDAHTGSRRVIGWRPFAVVVLVILGALIAVMSSTDSGTPPPGGTPRDSVEDWDRYCRAVAEQAMLVAQGRDQGIGQDVLESSVNSLSQQRRASSRARVQVGVSASQIC